MSWPLTVKVVYGFPPHPGSHGGRGGSSVYGTPYGTTGRTGHDDGCGHCTSATSANTSTTRRGWDPRVGVGADRTPETWDIRPAGK